VLVLEPRQRRLTADDETIDNVCLAFADIIDAKSPFTYQHSNGVAGAALEIARYLGTSDDDKKQLRRAALLHDIGRIPQTGLKSAARGSREPSSTAPARLPVT
jgi:HD-GYP domain-containing protein (c-di-GMP phosphodiesterase class II)